MPATLVKYAAAVLSLTAIISGCARTTDSADKPAADCKPQHTFSTVTPGVLKVAATDLPPFSALDGSTPTGVDGDIIKRFAEQNCLSVQGQSFSYATAIPALQANRADVVIGCWNRTTAREQVVSLSAPLYLDQMGLISREPVTTIAQLVGKRVGTPDGYLWVDDLKRLLGDDLSLYGTNVDAKNDLQAGRIDIAVDSYGAAVELFKGSDYTVSVAQPDPRVAASAEPAQAGFPVNKSNPNLLNALDATIAELHSDGTIAALLKDHGLDPSAADTGAPRLIG